MKILFLQSKVQCFLVFSCLWFPVYSLGVTIKEVGTKPLETIKFDINFDSFLKLERLDRRKRIDDRCSVYTV